MPVIRTSLAGGAVVASVNRWRARRLDCAPRSCATRSTAGRQVEVTTVGSASNGQQDERRVNRREQRRCHAQPQDPPEGGKQRHVHVVEHEHLIRAASRGGRDTAGRS